MAKLEKHPRDGRSCWYCGHRGKPGGELGPYYLAGKGWFWLHTGRCSARFHRDEWAKRKEVAEIFA